MKLTELNPHWTCEVAGRHGQGISFECPIHRSHRLAVAFVNPIDGGGKMDGNGYGPGPKFLWHREGETFETLTLGPSIDASGFTDGTHDIKTPCWHGFIKNGEVT